MPEHETEPMFEDCLEELALDTVVLFVWTH